MDAVVATVDALETVEPTGRRLRSAARISVLPPAVVEESCSRTTSFPLSLSSLALAAPFEDVRESRSTACCTRLVWDADGDGVDLGVAREGGAKTEAGGDREAEAVAIPGVETVGGDGRFSGGHLDFTSTGERKLVRSLPSSARSSCCCSDLLILPFPRLGCLSGGGFATPC